MGDELNASASMPAPVHPPERIWVSIKKRHWERMIESAKRSGNDLNTEIDRAIEHWLLINLEGDR